MGMLDDDEAHRRLGYHPAQPNTVPAFELNRSAGILLFQVWNGTLPAGREAALALTALQEAVMWANAAVACNAGDEWQLPSVDVSTELDDLTERLEGPLHLRSQLVGGGGAVSSGNGAEILPERAVVAPIEALEPAPPVGEHCLAVLTTNTGVVACSLEADHAGQHAGSGAVAGAGVMWS